jgi:hypothetical protein
MAGMQAQSPPVDPAKWLAILRVWVPTEPLDVLVDLINSLIEASGPARIDGLDDLIAHTDGTTRSGREKFERLRQWIDKMRADPRYWPPRFVRSRAVSILIKAILDRSSRPLDRFEVERKFRKFRDVPPSGLSQELKDSRRRHGRLFPRGNGARKTPFPRRERPKAPVSALPAVRFETAAAPVLGCGQSVVWNGDGVLPLQRPLTLVRTERLRGGGRRLWRMCGPRRGGSGQSKLRKHSNGVPVAACDCLRG